MSDEQIEQLEKEFIQRTSEAVRAASRRAFESGQSVLQAKDGVIYEVFPDGSKKFFKQAEPSVRIPVGTVIKLAETKVPRLRMFAGPNGSGKSTLKSVLEPTLLGTYLNPDEIEQEIRECGFL